MGAIPGSNEEHWYYALNRIDPHHDRYAAIVVPLAPASLADDGDAEAASSCFLKKESGDF